MTGTRFDFELLGIASALKGSKLAVPIFQRSFAWGSAEVSDYWNDVVTAFGGGGQEYFMGTIVIANAQNQGDRDQIIDGQQRLASTAILLSVLRDAYEDREDPRAAASVHGDFLASWDRRQSEDVPHVVMSAEDQVFFQKRVIDRPASDPGPSRGSHEKIASARNYFETELNALLDRAGDDWPEQVHSLIEFLTDQVQIMSIRVPDESEAYLIFETLNDRGADLTIADLLKNYLFGRSGGRLDTVRNGWIYALGELGLTAEDTLFTTFIRHYWSSRHGQTRERDLYASIKERVITETQVVEFIESLQKAASFYSALLNSDHDYWSNLGTSVKQNIKTLMRLRLEQNRPLLLAAMTHWQPAEVKKLMHSIIPWSVRGLIVGGIGAGKTETTFSAAAVKISEGDVKTVAELFPELSPIIPNDTEFKGAFVFARETRPRIARYYIHALERAAQGKTEPEMIPNANEEEVNLEHILPRNPTSDDWPEFTLDQARASVNRLGNLALLARGPNARIGNKPYSDKRPVLQASDLILTSEAGANVTWTIETIDIRQERLAELAIDTWPRNPIGT